jgi:hypothetical protein
MKRTSRPFKVFGDQEYRMEYIPSEHFQAIFTLALEGYLQNDTIETLDSIGLLAAKTGAEQGVSAKFDYIPQKEELIRAIVQCCQNMGDRLYQMMIDVLQYQNNVQTPPTMTELKKRVSAGELAAFIRVVLEDPEIDKAVEDLVEGLGKLMPKIQKGLTAQQETEA